MGWTFLNSGAFADKLETRSIVVIGVNYVGPLTSAMKESSRSVNEKKKKNQQLFQLTRCRHRP